MAASRLAIVSAMHEELRALLPALKDAHVVVVAGRQFHTGTLEGHAVVLVRAGIGKVATAVTATLLLADFDVGAIVFTGVAGGIGRGVRVGDVVVARQLIQHDMDASPLFPRFEVPLTGRARFDADAALSAALATSALRCLARASELLGEAHLIDFGIDSPLVHEGLVASGDRFVATADQSRVIAEALPDALAVEMEGAALAQVCADFDRPFAVLRTVSDRADDAAHADFTRFIAEVASVYTRVIVHDWLRSAPVTP
ncbi:MAG TPA: 5'-methylthioadenosine/adenosylhomocysteine nucleosidase [Albitalea sp.]|uniref:5'-methylthioadenosine/adenosylhomocysteine nucleosidase n=1 Tax=Piscinibacter sp. TaxID=1903157 RepID=UPI002ED65959